MTQGTTKDDKPFDFDDFEKAGSPFAANRVLFGWLCDDDHRAALYAHLRRHRIKSLSFRSRAEKRNEKGAVTGYDQEAVLVTDPELIAAALADGERFSNSPYRKMGSGTFMLGLDGDAHGQARGFATERLGPASNYACTPLHVAALSDLAFRTGSVLMLKSRQFDLAALAQQIALRFTGFLFGFGKQDHPLLEAAMTSASAAMNYLIVGRHFVTDPLVPAKADVPLAMLMQRAGELLDAYRTERLPEGVVDLDEVPGRPFEGFTPIMRRLALSPGDLSGNELAVNVVGLVAGIVGNVQSGICIAIQQFFKHRVIPKARAASYAEGDEMQRFILEAFRLNPPAPLLPRELHQPVDALQGVLPGTPLLLALGAVTRGTSKDADRFDPSRKNTDDWIFGYGPENRGIHGCFGRYLARPLITHAVRRIVQLPDLAQVLDPATGEAMPLEKQWGFGCRSYPLQHDRSQRLIQTPLNVIMKIRQPVAEHAEKLKKVIKYGSPEIEHVLEESHHVHMAWFQFLNNDTELALFTIYDGDFDAYIRHFALKVGDLFDKIFEHMEVAPPGPVKQYPMEFTDIIRRHDRPPAEGYFYSAYPSETVSRIQNAEKRTKASMPAPVRAAPEDKPAAPVIDLPVVTPAPVKPGKTAVDKAAKASTRTPVMAAAPPRARRAPAARRGKEVS